MEEKITVARFKKNAIQDWVDAILWAFVVAMIIRNYTFQNFKIPTSSMEKTLLVGDYLVANKMKYFFTEPKRDDIVTFRNPDDPLEPQPRDRFVQILPPIYWSKDKNTFVWHEKKNVVKRVIGMPGDTVEIVNKRVYINGEQYENGHEQFLDPRTFHRGAISRNMEVGLRDNFGPVAVPEGHYFVLGDNRDNSHDSRWWGFLDRNDITGTPAMIFLSVGEGMDFRWERSFTFIK
ncbi:MAG: signal peptidase I [Candidatus Cloacimonetes bacterium]|nr:signal peptidase I [Candidatus Cloacimonadota bacterium]